MQQLLLTKGQFALVDDCYYEQILALGHWCYAHNGYAFYTAATVIDAEPYSFSVYVWNSF